MKSTKKIKKELHEYIDSIDDEETLMRVHEEVEAYLKKDSADEEEELSEEDDQRLQAAIKQADAGETFPWEKLKANLEEWRKK